MLICFTGLHAAGKSYFLNQIPEYFDFKLFDKKEILKTLYYRETGKVDNHFNTWYGEKFAENPIKIVSDILECMPLDENCILDAVHSSYEWEIIHDLVPDSYLALMVTPSDMRNVRWERREPNARPLQIMDNKRIVYWHNPIAIRKCLPTHASWAFNGAASLESNLSMFKEFIDYINNKEQYNNPINVKKLERKRKPDE